MSFTKQELTNMAADIREAMIDINHQCRPPERASKRLENVMEELLIESFIMKEETVEDNPPNDYIGTVED